MLVIEAAGCEPALVAAELRVATDVTAGDVVVDLSQVMMLDSAMLGVLLVAARRLRAANRWLRVALCDPQLVHIVEITTIDRVLALAPSVAEALGPISRRRDIG